MSQDNSKILIASHNPGKIKEFQKLFQPYHIQIIPQRTLNIKEAEEPFPTFVENALQKARHASSFSQLPTIADDSGICVPALGNLPGIHSAHFADEIHPSDQKNNQKLSELLQNKSDKSVFYYCCLVFITHATDPTPIIAEGIWHGHWVDAAKGSNGFGYDPHFYLTKISKTVAELSPEEKNQYSHRAKAFKELVAKLKLSL